MEKHMEKAEKKIGNIWKYGKNTEKMGQIWERSGKTQDLPTKNMEGYGRIEKKTLELQKKKDGKNMKNIWQYMEKILEKCGKAQDLPDIAT